MVRRYCGIHQAIVTEGIDISKLAPMGKEDICQIFQASMDEVDMSIYYIQTAWRAMLADETMPSVSDPIEAPAKKQSEAKASAADNEIKLDFTMEQLALLNLGSFSTSIFSYPGHNAHDRYTEVEWFCEQIRDVRKVFEEPMAREMGHLALQNLLQLRRINDRLVVMDPADKEFIKLQATKTELEKAYEQQWEKVCELCPVAAASVGRKAAINNLSDIVKCYQTWKSDPNNRARDGIFTDDEVQILFRSSVQDPDVNYRMGWLLACLDAKRGINDPKWKRRMSVNQCKILDASFAHAARKMSEHWKVHRPDLEADGPAGEYAPLHLKDDGEVTEERFNEEQVAAAGPEETVEIA